jgi:hypothetical protein
MTTWGKIKMATSDTGLIAPDVMSLEFILIGHVPSRVKFQALALGEHWKIPTRVLVL